MKKANRTFFVATSPGLQHVTAAELKSIGIEATAETGGLSFPGRLPQLYLACRELRTAARISMRMEEFYVGGFPELKRKVARIPWEDVLRPGTNVTMRVTAKKSRLYHSDAIAERVVTAISGRLNRVIKLVKASDKAAINSQLIIIRMIHNTCTISVDAAGAPLHQRGYRQAVGKAPLRENLAAGLLLSAGWDGTQTLVDPFCGSGTIAIEAAMMALRQAPGSNRTFRYTNWPICKNHKNASLPTPARDSKAEMPLIIASDRDTGAIENARQNAKRAGVDAHIQFIEQPLSELKLPDGGGWIVTNPPYGERLKPDKDLRDLYARLGQMMKPNWKMAFLCANQELPPATRLKLEKGPVLDNGGLSTRIYIRR
ncbi:MAG: THUMP domain-containing class I SAM-dependent RNA methyltransferase [Calditrichia bacterium]